jgi:hypothetical protein
VGINVENEREGRGELPLSEWVAVGLITLEDVIEEMMQVRRV